MQAPDLRVPHPGPKTRELLAKVRQYEAPADCTFNLSAETVVEDRGEGVAIIDPDGNVFLDLMAGFGVVNAGHSHPKVVAAIKEQAEKLTHIMGAANTVRTDLLELLPKVTPGDGPKKIQFGNSGSEAVEVALKLARYYTKKSEIIGFQGAFHGRTYGALSLIGRAYARKGLYPMLPGVTQIPYGYCYRCAYGKEYPSCDMQCVKYIEWLIKGPVTGVTEPAAIIGESIQGNGGMIVPPEPFWSEIRRICDETGVVLIVDEVMAGWGRTGKMFAIEHWGVVPDILTCAKGIANGLPLSAAIARADIADAWEPLRDGTTFSGNPVACAAALATINAYLEEKLVENAAEVGSYLIDGLRALSEELLIIGDVRGKALMCSIELVGDRKEKTPLRQVAMKISDLALRRGLMIYPCGYYNNVIAFLPPLVLAKGDVDTALEILGDVLREVQQEALGTGSAGPVRVAPVA